MLLSANQPYFAPYPGFFYKVSLSDVFVILDTVQFPRGTTWLSRNRFKNDQGAMWLTVPVWKKGLGLQRINDVRIYHEGRWSMKHRASLETAYARSPYFEEYGHLVAEMFSEKFERLVDLNMAVIRHLLHALHIDTRVVLLSEMEIDAEGDRLIIDICQRLGADVFLAQKPAGKFLDAALFSDAGIEIRYVTPPAPVYPQLWGDFIP
ncbi:MAG: WbqC family protein, partial [Deltaproteobacteria bacterium]|nr:WbqC family protein [Deltaproteobacteria bacterium]